MYVNRILINQYEYVEIYALHKSMEHIYIFV